MKNINALRQRKFDLQARANGILANSSQGLKPHTKQTLASIRAELGIVEDEIIETEQELLRELNPNAQLAAHHGGGRTNMTSRGAAPPLYLAFQNVTTIGSRFGGEAVPPLGRG